MAAVENDDTQPAGNQIVEAANRTGRVGERERGSALAYRWNVSFVHGATIAAPTHQRNIVPSPTITHRPPIRIAYPPLSLRATST